MNQSSNGQPYRGKPKGNYTGERLKVLRPETYRRVVRLLAEPREHVSYREICRQCHVTDDTVKAVEQREAIPIATRKQTLMEQAARIAKLAADRVEDQIDGATLPQAVVAFGVMTDKVLALSADPAVIIRHEHQHLHAHQHHFQAITRGKFDEILDALPSLPAQGQGAQGQGMHLKKPRHRTAKSCRRSRGCRAWGSRGRVITFAARLRADEKQTNGR